MRIAVLATLLLLTTACATGRPDSNQLDRTLYEYAGAIRWNQVDRALDFIDPDRRAALAPSAIERKRIDQLQVTAYNVQGSQPISDTELLQQVEIRLVNRHTQVERSLIDRQRWIWDGEAKTWWLASGLPDFSPR